MVAMDDGGSSTLEEASSTVADTSTPPDPTTDAAPTPTCPATGPLRRPPLHVIALPRPLYGEWVVRYRWEHLPRNPTRGLHVT